METLQIHENSIEKLIELLLASQTWMSNTSKICQSFWYISVPKPSFLTNYRFILSTESQAKTLHTLVGHDSIEKRLILFIFIRILTFQKIRKVLFIPLYLNIVTQKIWHLRAWFPPAKPQSLGFTLVPEDWFYIHLLTFPSDSW